MTLTENKWVIYLKEIVSSLHLLEITIFFILATITVYRRRLSSNDKYREENANRPRHQSQSLLGYLNNGIIAIIERILWLLSSWRDLTSKSSRTTVSRVKIERNLLRNKTDSQAFQVEKRKPNISEERTDLRHHMKDGNTLQSLAADNILHIVSMLSNADLVSLTATCQYFHRELNTDCLWEYIWMSRYGRMWMNPVIRSIRLKRNIVWEPIVSVSHSQGLPSSRKFPRPTQGWREFCREFEECWIDWLLAGACSEDYCLIGLHQSILDITSFVPLHPGSPESLMEHAGRDASTSFAEIGHSIYAFAKAQQYVIFEPSDWKTDLNISERAALFENPLLAANTMSTLAPSVTRQSKRMHEEGLRALSQANPQSGLLTNISRTFYLLTSSSTSDTTSSSSSSVNSCCLPQPLIPDLHRSYECYRSLETGSSANVVHPCQCRSFWDPLQRKWHVWWTCCGYEEIVA